MTKAATPVYVARSPIYWGCGSTPAEAHHSLLRAAQKVDVPGVEIFKLPDGAHTPHVDLQTGDIYWQGPPGEVSLCCPL